MHTGIWPENLKGRDHFGDKGIWEDIIKMDRKEIERIVDSAGS
jgi:hypothetical protein